VSLNFLFQIFSEKKFDWSASFESESIKPPTMENFNKGKFVKLFFFTPFILKSSWLPFGLLQVSEIDLKKANFYPVRSKNLFESGQKIT